MPSMLDRLTAYPPFWLGLYLCGAGMIVVTLAATLGAIAAGSAVGFFLLAGVFGYELVARRGLESTIAQRVTLLERETENLMRDAARSRNDIDSLKDDMAETAQTLNREVHKILNQAEPASRAPANAMRVMQKSFERMGNKSRSSFMPQQDAANEAISAQTDIHDTGLSAPARSVASKTQKYKDLLLMAAARQEKMAESAKAIEPAPQYSDAVVAELVSHAVRNERIEVFAQPIVKLPSRRLQYLELFARIRARSGIYLTGENYRSMAERENMIENLDHLLLMHVLDTIRSDARRNIDIGYFINIAARCLENKSYMTDIIEFVKSRRELAPRLVFELQYADFKKLTPAMRKMIDGLAHIGCKFSADNVSDSNFDADQLAETGFVFVKFSSGKLMELCQTSKGEMEVARMKAALDRSGITLIVEKLEDEHDLKELLDFEIDYGEGYLFGKPDLEMAYRPRRSA